MPGKFREIVYYIITAAIFITMEVAAIAMLKYSGPLQDIWVSRMSHRVMATVWGSSGNIKNYLSLKKQNDALAEENSLLMARLASLTENGAVVDSTQSYFRYIPATVVKMSRNTQHNYFIINKGFEDGVRPQSGIVSGKGVVGIIDAVDRNYSYGLSLLNSDTSISARIGKEGAVGLLSWSGMGDDSAIMRGVSLQADFAPKDTVWTSGFSSIFPPDVPLGTIESSKVVNGAVLELNVTLFEDFSAIRYVTVVSNEDADEILSIENLGEKEDE